MRNIVICAIGNILARHNLSLHSADACHLFCAMARTKGKRKHGPDTGAQQPTKRRRTTFLGQASRQETTVDGSPVDEAEPEEAVAAAVAAVAAPVGTNSDEAIEAAVGTDSDDEDEDASLHDNQEIENACTRLFHVAASGLEATNTAASLSRRKGALFLQNARISGVDFDAADKAAESAIIHLRDYKKLILPRDTVEDIIRQIGYSLRPNKGGRFSFGAIAAMHIACETALVNFFRQANISARKNRRVTIKAPDLNVAKQWFFQEAQNRTAGGAAHSQQTPTQLHAPEGTTNL